MKEKNTSIEESYNKFESSANIYNPNENKKTMIATGNLVILGWLITYVITNDVTGIGVADDLAYHYLFCVEVNYN